MEEVPLTAEAIPMMTDPIPVPGAKTKMEERRFGQQEMLERLLETVDHIHNELGSLSVTMTDRVAKLEQDAKAMARDLTAISIVASRHSESISWIKGAGTGSLAVLSVVLIWILSHLVFKP